MKQNIAYKIDNRYGCQICNREYADKSAVYRHYKRNHKIEPTVCEKINVISEQMNTLVNEMQDFKKQNPATSAPVINNNNNNNNNTIYFNKDLKYYPELVKIMGREKACNYLLYGMPETKDIFGVIDKLFLQNGALGCPFRYDQDTGDFLIARAQGVFDRDPTGETIDRENKSKLQDAILSAYVDTTKQISRECADLRIARLNGEYTEADQEKLTRRFDALMTVEPIRPYEVIDLMNGLKPKKRDFDKIKKMCPAIVKKITIS